MSYEYTYKYNNTKYNISDSVTNYLEYMKFLKTSDNEYYEVIRVCDNCTQVECRLNTSNTIMISYKDIALMHDTVPFFISDKDIAKCIVRIPSPYSSEFHKITFINHHNEIFMLNIFKYLKDTISMSLTEVSLNFLNKLGDSAIEIIFFLDSGDITLRFKE